jgi:hypothetical protein
MKSWQIYDLARKALKSEMYEIYGNRSSRMIDYWAQDPAFSADPKRNPIDRLGLLVTRLDAAGYRDVALSALRLLAGGLDCAVEEREEVVPDRPTLLGEIIDDMPCLVAYQRALEGDDLEEVDRCEAELQRELAENRVKFLELHAEKNNAEK